MLEKKQFINPGEAMEYATRLKVKGFKVVKFVKEFNKFAVYYKRY